MWANSVITKNTRDPSITCLWSASDFLDRQPGRPDFVRIVEIVHHFGSPSLSDARTFASLTICPREAGWREAFANAAPRCDRGLAPFVRAAAPAADRFVIFT